MAASSVRAIWKQWAGDKEEKPQETPAPSTEQTNTAAVPFDAATALERKIGALVNKIERLQRQALPENPVRGVSTAIWVSCDVLLALACLDYAFDLGEIAHYTALDKEYYKFFISDVTNIEQVTKSTRIVYLLGIGTVISLWSLRHVMTCWLIYNALKIPAACLLLMLPGAWLFSIYDIQWPQLPAYLYWLSINMALVVSAFYVVLSGYRLCRQRARGRIAERVAEVSAEINALMPGDDAEAGANDPPPPVLYDNVID